MTEKEHPDTARPDDDVEGHELIIDPSATGAQATDDDDSDDVEGHRFY
jgi:hypothetical protein